MSVDDRIECRTFGRASRGSRVASPRPPTLAALALLGTAFFMVILDGTIVITALPVIGHELGLSAGGLQ